MEASGTKLKRTLILHGYGQSANIAKQKWDRTFKKIGLEPVYLEAPLDVTNKDGNPAKGWFTWEGDSMIYTSTKYMRVQESLVYIRDAIIEKGPFDVIIGYSQGGSILSILMDRYTIPVSFVIIISSYEVIDSEWKIARKVPKVPTLVVAGQKDEIVPLQYTKNIYDLDAIELYVHEGTHSIPLNMVFISKVREFLNVDIYDSMGLKIQTLQSGYIEGEDVKEALQLSIKSDSD